MRRRLRGPVPLDKLGPFVLKARRETYDQRPVPLPFLPDTFLIGHSSNPFQYRAILFGQRGAWRSNKVETVVLNGRLVWHGSTDFGVLFKRLYGLREEFLEFVDKTLREHPETRLDQFVDVMEGKWYYVYDGQGSIDECFGPEMIFWDDRLIARGFFSGRLHTRY